MPGCRLIEWMSRILRAIKGECSIEAQVFVGKESGIGEEDKQPSCVQGTKKS